MLGNLEIFHYGLVVEDIDAAMDALGSRFELTWAPVQETPVHVHTGDGENLTENLRFTYSVQGPPNLELIQSTERKLWSPGPTGHLHHVGAYDDDFTGALERFQSNGSVLEFGGGHGEQPKGFAYFLVPGGARVEIIDGGRRALFDEWLAGGQY
jgi:hypothetical protein